MMSNLEFTLGEDPEEDDGVTFASTLANSFNDEDAPTGTESYEALSDSDLCTHYLGLTSMDDVPGLNKTTPKSVTDMHLDPWQDETKSFFADDKNLEALRLDRLQWDAVAAAVTNAFKGSPLYITDEVGTGKTYSALAFVNLTIRWRIYHTQMNKFAARLYGKYNPDLILSHITNRKCLTQLICHGLRTPTYILMSDGCPTFQRYQNQVAFQTVQPW